MYLKQKRRILSSKISAKNLFLNLEKIHLTLKCKNLFQEIHDPIKRLPEKLRGKVSAKNIDASSLKILFSSFFKSEKNDRNVINLDVEDFFRQK